MSGVEWDDEAPATQGVEWDDETPAPRSRLSSALDKAKAFGRGVRQGGTLGFGDEWGGAVQSNAASLTKALGRLGLNRVGDILGLETRYPDEVDPAEAYRQGRDAERADDAGAMGAAPGWYLGGEMVGGLAAPVPGGAAVQGASKLTRLARAANQGVKMGAAYGAGKSESDSAAGLAGDTVMGAALGGAGGTLAHGAGGLLGALGKYAGRRVAKVESDVAEAAAKEAAEATASAKSAAGTSAQDAYKQLEHLRELKRVRELAPDEARAFHELEQELGQKAQEKLLPAAARKAAKAEEYVTAKATETDRAAALGREKLSGAELKRQVKARAKRYGLPALGGAIVGGITDDDSAMGVLTGAGVGGLAGAGLRPMMRSLVNLKNQPVVQRALWKTLEVVPGKTGGAVEKAATTAQRPLSPDFEEVLIPFLAELELEEGNDGVAKTRSLAELLRRRKP